MKYLITSMTTDADILGKAYVHYKSWHETYRGLVDDSYLDKITLEKCSDIARRFKDNILVAKDDGGNVVGFAAYGAYRDDTLPDTGEIYTIYVLAEHHSRRVGYELMNAAIGALPDYGKIALWVLDGNEHAIRFYEKYGFRFDGEKADIKLGTPRVERRMIYTRKSEV